MGLRSGVRDALLPQPPSFKKKKEYVLEEVLGRGGFGKVVKAIWTPEGGEKKDVAIKIISKRLVLDSNTNVMDEINVLKDLDHPNIVHVWDHFESRDKYYITFELAVGGELFDRIQERGRFTEKNAAEVIRQVLSATAYLHAHNIVHRDLKPENIIFKTRDETSPVVIADFGIAKHLDTPDEQIADVAGSLGYAAPEVLMGKGHGVKVDCWSIGVIAYTLLCGYSPWRAEDKSELERETTKGRIIFHERFWTKVSKQAKDFIRALVQVDPKQRLSAAEALQHPWITSCEATDHNLAPTFKANFNAKAKWSKALKVINASNRIRSLTPSTTGSSISTSTPNESNTDPLTASNTLANASAPPSRQPSYQSPQSPTRSPGPNAKTSKEPMIIPSVVAPDSDDDSLQGDYATASEGPPTPSRSRDEEVTAPRPSGTAQKTGGTNTDGPEPAGGMSVREATRLAESPDRSTAGGLKGLMGKLGI